MSKHCSHLLDGTLGLKPVVISKKIPKSTQSVYRSREGNLPLVRAESRTSSTARALEPSDIQIDELSGSVSIATILL